ATPDKNVKKATNAFLILEDFNPPLYELPFHKEVPGLGALLSFSPENEEKSTTLGFLLLKEFILFFSRNYLIGALKLSKSLKFLKARWRFFLTLTKRTSESWMFRVSTSIPLDKLKYGGLGQAIGPKTSASWEAPHAYPSIIVVVVVVVDCPDFEASRARGFYPSITRASNPQLHFGNPIS
ncbi:hypothetical protein Tco_0160725, partial [Tanacetum coccineum]